MGKSRGLRALEAAQILAAETIEAAKKFPKPDLAGLRYQICEAANSVHANIAEGMGRATPAERLNRLRLARGELDEMQSHLKVCRRVRYVERRTFFRLWNLAEVVDRMIVNLMRRRW